MVVVVVVVVVNLLLVPDTRYDQIQCGISPAYSYVVFTTAVPVPVERPVHFVHVPIGAFKHSRTAVSACRCSCACTSASLENTL
eukprot:SAG31_NODE_837_length_11633_cov_18.437663_3_plen_84_part_00